MCLPLLLHAQLFQKPYVETIDKAKTEGITIQQLDSLYRSAVHVDSTKAAFNTNEMADSLVRAYTNFLQGLGVYLKEHDFKWEQPTRCWNRIYFNRGGSVDYYLFDFKTAVSDEKIQRYKELFRQYVATHKIGITATVDFAQCSPVTYMDK